MDTDTAKQVIAATFRQLPAENRSNLRNHAIAGSPINCGPNAIYVTPHDCREAVGHCPLALATFPVGATYRAGDFYALSLRVDYVQFHYALSMLGENDIRALAQAVEA